MTPTIRHAGYVDADGQPHMLNEDAWKAALRRLRGRDVYFTVARKAQPKTRDQMGYYRGVVLPLLAESWGWDDTDELHFRLKEKWLPPIIPVNQWPYRKLGTVEMREPPSSADLTMEQFSAFLTAVITHAAHEGITVPEPHQVSA